MVAVFADQPTLILLVIMIGSSLMLAEAALPTMGALGLAGVAGAVIGVASLVESGLDGWPLMISGTGVVLLGLMLLRRQLVPLEVGIALVMIFVGQAVFAWLAEDIGSLVAAALSTIIGAWAFRPLHRAARRLVDAPSVIEYAGDGREAVVISWDDDHGVVRAEGSLWNATASTGRPAVGATVEVVDRNRLKLVVRPIPLVPGAPGRADR